MSFIPPTCQTNPRRSHVGELTALRASALASDLTHVPRTDHLTTRARRSPGEIRLSSRRTGTEPQDRAERQDRVATRGPGGDAGRELGRTPYCPETRRRTTLRMFPATGHTAGERIVNWHARSARSAPRSLRRRPSGVARPVNGPGRRAPIRHSPPPLAAVSTTPSDGPRATPPMAVAEQVPLLEWPGVTSAAWTHPRAWVGPFPGARPEAAGPQPNPESPST